jgi:hypothetical protein
MAKSNKLTLMSGKKLPQFIIIGAAKAATTWLSTVLSRQSAVFMPAPELHYFNRNYGKGEAWYVEHFADARTDQIIGEKSASYLADLHVPARIKELLPQVRLIVQLRNPIERAYSDYCMLLRRGEVGADIARYLDPDGTPVRRFIEHGLYARHLAAFLAVFRHQQIKVLLYDDIVGDPEGVYGEVVHFVGLTEPASLDHVTDRIKDKATPMLPMSIRRLMRPLKGVARPLRSKPAFRQAHRLLARPITYPPLGAAIQRRLAAFYASDVRELERMIDRDLDAWLKPAVKEA